MLFDLLDISKSRHVENCCMNIYPIPEYHMERTLKIHDLLYIVDGEWGVEQDSVVYSLKAGDALLLRAGSHHAGSSPNTPNTKAFYVHFSALPQDKSDVDLTKADLVTYARGNTCCISTITECGKNPVIPRLFSELINLFYSERPDIERLSSLLLNQLLNELAAISRTTLPAKEEWLVKILRLFRSNMKRMYSLQELSDISHISQRTLVSRFSKAVGQSPYQYQLNLHLDTAKKLLTDTDMSLKEIAVSVGFCDAYQLSRMFKKKLGVSPTVYKNSILRINVNMKGKKI